MAGGADSNIEFAELGKFLVGLGFEERTIKRDRESVCYKRDYRGSDGGGALFMMSVGPSRSACRRRFQTVASGGIKRVFLVNVVKAKGHRLFE